MRTTEAAKLMDTTPSIIKKLIKNGQIPPDCATYFPPAKDDTYPYYHINGPKFKEWLEGNAHVTIHTPATRLLPIRTQAGSVNARPNCVYRW